MEMPAVVVIVALLWATWIDFRTLRVPNALTVPLILGALVYHTFASGLEGLGQSVLGMLVGLLVLVVPYVLGSMGAGDVKLVSAVGAWLGASMLWTILAFGLLTSGMWSLAVLIHRRQLVDSWTTFKMAACQCSAFVSGGPPLPRTEGVSEMAKTAAGRKRLIPFSGMVAVGMLAALVWSKLA